MYPQFLDPPAWLPPSDSVNLSISARPLPSSVSSSPADAAASSASTSDLQPRLLEAFSEFKDEAEEGGFELLDRIEGGDEGAVELVRKSGRAMAFGEWAECVLAPCFLPSLARLPRDRRLGDKQDV